MIKLLLRSGSEIIGFGGKICQFFRDPLSMVDCSNVKVECNGENGHDEGDDDSESDPLAIPEVGTNSSDGGPPKKKTRKSSAEKFLEDNSEYYGFQVLPSKLRSSSLESPFPNPFLDFLHQGHVEGRTSLSNSGDHVNADHGAGISSGTDANQKQKEPHVRAENDTVHSIKIEHYYITQWSKRRETDFEGFFLLKLYSKDPQDVSIVLNNKNIFTTNCVVAI